VALIAPAEGKVQCSCPKVNADGEGNTACSVSENGNRCTVDFNLFGRESEERAAELLRKNGAVNLSPPNPDLSCDEALQQLNFKDGKELQDAVMVYLAVAFGDQLSRRHETVHVNSLGELVKAMQSEEFGRRVQEAFSVQARKQWSDYPDEKLRNAARDIPVQAVGSATISPGCIEFQTSDGLWLMFKANWSPARSKPGCGKVPRSSTKTRNWHSKGLAIALGIGIGVGYAAHH
jgi:hypothetical protein